MPCTCDTLWHPMTCMTYGMAILTTLHMTPYDTLTLPMTPWHYVWHPMTPYDVYDLWDGNTDDTTYDTLWHPDTTYDTLTLRMTPHDTLWRKFRCLPCGHSRRENGVS